MLVDFAKAWFPGNSCTLFLNFLVLVRVLYSGYKLLILISKQLSYKVAFYLNLLALKRDADRET